MLGERPSVLLTIPDLLISVGAILGLLPLSGTAERAAAAVCISTVFLTNVLATALAGEQLCENNSQDFLSLTRSLADLVDFTASCQLSGRKLTKEIHGFTSYSVSFDLHT